MIPEEHLFVPAPDSSNETGGWMMGTALNLRRGATELSVFGAERLDDGPLAIRHLPYALPLGLHGCFAQGRV